MFVATISSAFLITTTTALACPHTVQVCRSWKRKMRKMATVICYMSTPSPWALVMMKRHHAVCVLCASGDDLCHLKHIVRSFKVSKNLTMIAAVYLSLSLPPVEFPTRKTLDYWLPVALVRWPWLRHVIETGTILSISLLLALLFPSSSAKVSTAHTRTAVLIV